MTFQRRSSLSSKGQRLTARSYRDFLDLKCLGTNNSSDAGAVSPSCPRYLLTSSALQRANNVSQVELFRRCNSEDGKELSTSPSKKLNCSYQVHHSLQPESHEQARDTSDNLTMHNISAKRELYCCEQEKVAVDRLCMLTNDPGMDLASGGNKKSRPSEENSLDETRRDVAKDLVHKISSRIDIEYNEEMDGIVYVDPLKEGNSKLASPDHQKEEKEAAENGQCSRKVVTKNLVQELEQGDIGKYHSNKMCSGWQSMVEEEELEEGEIRGSPQNRTCYEQPTLNEEEELEEGEIWETPDRIEDEELEEGEIRECHDNVISRKQLTLGEQGMSLFETKTKIPSLTHAPRTSASEISAPYNQIALSSDGDRHLVSGAGSGSKDGFTSHRDVGTPSILHSGGGEFIQVEQPVNHSLEAGPVKDTTSSGSEFNHRKRMHCSKHSLKDPTREAMEPTVVRRQQSRGKFSGDKGTLQTVVCEGSPPIPLKRRRHSNLTQRRSAASSSKRGPVKRQCPSFPGVHYTSVALLNNGDIFSNQNRVITRCESEPRAPAPHLRYINVGVFNA